MAWTNAWNETKPADSDLANTLGAQGRQVKLDIRERLNFGHIFGQSQTTDGEHRNIILSANGLAANQEAIKVSGFTLTGVNAQSIVDLAGFWNTSGAPTAVKVNITDAASQPGSLLLDLQVAGVSKFKVDKSGNVTTTGNNAVALNVVGTTVNYAMSASDDVVIAFGAITITLPPPTSKKTLIQVKNGGGATVTVQGDTGAATIDGATTFPLQVQNQSVSLVNNGVVWFIV